MLRRLRIENLVLIREADLAFGPGLNAITGETGAGKTIFAQAVGLLLGARADASSVGAEGSEAYVEAELDVPTGFFDEEEVATLAELRPEGEAGLVLARRVFGDGRTRAYAWGRAVAREDVAAAAERMIAMSGQFEQRRLARGSFQLEVLDTFCGAEQVARRRETAVAWRELAAARRRYEELSRDADAAVARLAELEALVEDTDGLAPGDADALRTQRERLRHVAELEEAAATAAAAIAPDEGAGAASLAAQAERVLAPLERIAPELGVMATELRDVALRLGELGSELHTFLASLEADPGELDEVEERLARIAGLQRRFDATSFEELLERSAAARRELDEAGVGLDPVAAAADTVAAADARLGAFVEELRAVRRSQARPFADVVSEELQGLGMGDGEFLVELRERDVGASGVDEVAFLIRPNQGLPFGPVAETASGGELSRIALALAAVAGGETLVFDEIDAGIGGVTAHAVASTLQRLSERAQVLTITHLPQIASVADCHFRVEKVPGDPTHTRIEELDDPARREEVERMLGGQEFLATLGEGRGQAEA
ncbi:MAG: AAA family ATPase [Actinobacteria bacterium]|nr:AAA family ATPase [Actinomycetota bacterium]